MNDDYGYTEDMSPEDADYALCKACYPKLKRFKDVSTLKLNIYNYAVS